MKKIVFPVFFFVTRGGWATQPIKNSTVPKICAWFWNALCLNRVGRFEPLNPGDGVDQAPFRGPRGSPQEVVGEMLRKTFSSGNVVWGASQKQRKVYERANVMIEK